MSKLTSFILGVVVTVLGVLSVPALCHEFYVSWSPGEKLIQFNGTVIEVKP